MCKRNSKKSARSSLPASFLRNRCPGDSCVLLRCIFVTSPEAGSTSLHPHDAPTSRTHERDLSLTQGHKPSGTPRSSDRHVHRNFRVALVAFDCEIRKLEGVDVAHFGVDLERRERVRLALNLLLQCLHVVAEARQRGWGWVGRQQGKAETRAQSVGTQVPSRKLQGRASPHIFVPLR